MNLIKIIIPFLVITEIILVKTGRSAVRDQGVHSHRRMPFPVKVLRDFPSQLVVAAIVSQQAQISPDVKREHGGRVHIESPHVQISRRRLPVRPIVDCVGRHAASVLHILEGQPRIHARQILVFRVLVHDELRVQLIQPHLRPVRIAQTVKRTLAGKSGTSNDNFDTWFIGFSPDLVVGVYVGYDTPRTLGPRDTGGVVAAPIFRDFMAAALKDKPDIPFRVPPGVRLVRVNLKTGKPAKPGDKEVILEAFRKETDLNYETPIIGQDVTLKPENVPDLGGLY